MIEGTNEELADRYRDLIESLSDVDHLVNVYRDKKTGCISAFTYMNDGRTRSRGLRKLVLEAGGPDIGSNHAVLKRVCIVCTSEFESIREKLCCSETCERRRFNEEERCRLYGLEPGQFDCMSEQQEHKCRICCREVTLVVDHCHKTEQVRGLLCISCNSKLGWFEAYKDEIAEYLRISQGAPQNPM